MRKYLTRTCTFYKHDLMRRPRPPPQHEPRTASMMEVPDFVLPPLLVIASKSLPSGVSYPPLASVLPSSRPAAAPDEFTSSVHSGYSAGSTETVDAPWFENSARNLGQLMKPQLPSCPKSSDHFQSKFESGTGRRRNCSISSLEVLSHGSRVLRDAGSGFLRMLGKRESEYVDWASDFSGWEPEDKTVPEPVSTATKSVALVLNQKQSHLPSNPKADSRSWFRCVKESFSTKK